MKIAVIGLGYVGLSMAVLLSSKYKVYAHDISKKKILELNNGIVPFQDPDIPEYLQIRGYELIKGECRTEKFSEPGEYTVKQ